MATRMIARLFALLLVLVALPVVWYYPAEISVRPPIRTTAANGQWVVGSESAQAKRAGVHLGDVVDLSGDDRRQMFLAQFGHPRGMTAYRIVHNGTERTVNLAPTIRSPFAQTDSALATLAILLLGTITILVAVVVLWRRPGPVAFALGVYALGTIFSAEAIWLVRWLPGPFFTAAFVFLDTAVGSAPALALVYFAMRFPEERLTRRSRAWTAAGTVLLAGVLAAAAIHDLFVQSLLDADNAWTGIVLPAAANAVAIVIVLIKYGVAAGQERRRIAWVLVGVVVSGVGYVLSNIPAIAPAPSEQIAAVGALLQLALPVTLAYAILRHRVLDLGFAVNRTLVYATITGAVVVIVSAVDWFSGRYFEGSKLSLALEGAIAIGLGVMLNWFHKRVERGIDRVLFRERHRAAMRIEARIRALDFAETPATVDDALVTEAAGIMGLRSAAVFRVNESGDFVRLAATGWEQSASLLPREHLLFRTLRAEEHTIVLSDHAIDTSMFPHGTARPDIAIPIGIRHQLLGCVLYGHREGDASLDPEERALLERLAHASSTAYDAIEATQWRKRALAFEGGMAVGLT